MSAVHQICFAADIAAKATVSIMQHSLDDDFQPRRLVVNEGAMVQRSFGERDPVETEVESDALLIRSIWVDAQQVTELWTDHEAVEVMPPHPAYDFVAGAVPVRFMLIRFRPMKVLSLTFHLITSLVVSIWRA